MLTRQLEFPFPHLLHELTRNKNRFWSRVGRLCVNSVSSAKTREHAIELASPEGFSFQLKMTALIAVSCAKKKKKNSPRLVSFFSSTSRIRVRCSGLYWLRLSSSITPNSPSLRCVVVCRALLCLRALWSRFSMLTILSVRGSLCSCGVLALLWWRFLSYVKLFFC